MAAAADVESIKDDFLTCSICTDTFTDPCTLNCQHSFCRRCLTDYIQSRPNCIQANIIPCAFCLQSTPVVNPTQPVAEWAEQQKPSLMLKGLMDKFLKENEEKEELEGSETCFLCMEVGDINHASSWCCDCDIILCSRCARMHTKMSSNKDHTIKDLSERETGNNDKETLCPDHNEDITLVCRDCNNTLCQKCHKLNHYKCSDVVTLDSLLPEIKSTMTGKRRILLAMVEKESAVEKIASSNIQILREGEAKSGKAVRKSFDDVVNLVREREAAILRKLRVDVNGRVTKQKVVMNAAQSNIHTMKQQLKVIDQTLQARSDVEIYQRQNTWMENEENDAFDTGQISENADRMKNETGEMSFEADIERMTEMICKFGQFTNVNNTQSEWTDPYITLVNQESKTRTSFCVNDKNEKEQCYFPDFTVLVIGGSPLLVATDLKHKKLKSVSLKDANQTWNELNLKGQPLRIAKLSETRVVITLKPNYLLIADVQQRKPTLVSVIKTAEQYHGLAVLSDGRLVVGRDSRDSRGYLLHSYIEIIKTDSTVLQSFSNKDYSCIDLSNYIAVSHDDNIIFSNRYTRLNSLTPIGKSVFENNDNKGLTTTCGIAVTKTGEIVQADTERIILFASDGKYKCDLLSEIHDLKNIEGICVEGRDLYVSTGNTILVYTLT